MRCWIGNDHCSFYQDFRLNVNGEMLSVSCTRGTSGSGASRPAPSPTLPCVPVHTWGNTCAWERGRDARVASPRASCPRSQETREPVFPRRGREPRASPQRGRMAGGRATARGALPRVNPATGVAGGSPARVPGTVHRFLHPRWCRTLRGARPAYPPMLLRLTIEYTSTWQMSDER